MTLNRIQQIYTAKAEAFHLPRLDLKGSLLIGAMAAIIAFPTVVNAQELDRGKSVTERSHGETAPLGMHVGSFMFHPSVTVSEKYDSNIYAANTGEEDDLVTVVNPALSIESDWNNHALNFKADAKVGLYADNTDENYDDYMAALDGRVDVTRDLTVTGSLTCQDGHEDRGSPDSIGAANEPNEYDTFTTAIDLSHDFNRWNVALGGKWMAYNYDDNSTAAGVNINNDDRDRDQYSVTARVGYDIQPEYEAFLRTIYNRHVYDTLLDDGITQNRDSKGYRIEGGVSIDMTGLLIGDIYAGYLCQNFDHSPYKTANSVAYGIDLFWNATELTSVVGNVDVNVADTTVVGASSSINSSLKVKVDHELTRDLLINGTAGYAVNDYKGISREDEYLTFGLGAKYMLARNTDIVADYNFTNRDSDAVNSDYDKSELVLRLKYEL